MNAHTFRVIIKLLAMIYTQINKTGPRLEFDDQGMPVL